MSSKSLRDSLTETIARYYNFFKLGPQQTDQQTEPEVKKEGVDKTLTSDLPTAEKDTVDKTHTSELSTVDKMLTSKTPTVDETLTSETSTVDQTPTSELSTVGEMLTSNLSTVTATQSTTDESVGKMHTSKTSTVGKTLTSKMSTVDETHTSNSPTVDEALTSEKSTVDKTHTSKLSTLAVDKTPTVGNVTPLGETLTAEEIVTMIDKICDLDTTPTTMQVLLRMLIKYKNTKLMFSVRKLALELHHDHARLQKYLSELHKHGVLTVFASPRGTIVDFTPLRGVDKMRTPFDGSSSSNSRYITTTNYYNNGVYAKQLHLATALLILFDYNPAKIPKAVLSKLLKLEPINIARLLSYSQRGKDRYAYLQSALQHKYYKATTLEEDAQAEQKLQQAQILVKLAEQTAEEWVLEHGKNICESILNVPTHRLIAKAEEVSKQFKQFLADLSASLQA